MTLAAAESPLDITRDSQPKHDCPGLSLYTSWDAEASLRGEILPSERMTEHAVEIALAHGAPSFGSSSRPLRRRFAAAQSRIREAYATLGRNANLGRERSPAEEWLIDNSHVVAEQIREIREDLPWGYLRKLPRISQGAMKGYPRVYGLCLDYLRHTDARVDLATVVAYVQSYQTQGLLTIGELWAVPIMLRLGLILTVGSVAISAAGADDVAKADALAERLVENASQPLRIKAMLMELDRRAQPPSAAFLVELLKRQRDSDVALGIVSDWVRIQCEKMGTNAEELVRRQHLRLSADQVSVANAITSMSSITALNWNDFFEQTSAVEAVLRDDPAAAYAASDEISRDRCRHAVEKIARRGTFREVEVAKVALQLARAASQRLDTNIAQSHVGYYLVDRGRREVEAIAEYRVPIRQHFGRVVLQYPAVVYFGFIVSLTLALCALGARFLIHGNVSTGYRLFFASLMAIPVSEIAIAVVNAAVVSILPPRLLQKLEFKSEIPAEFRTLVVVPVIVDSSKTVDSLLEDLEVRSLANSDQGLQFALLTDFVDAQQETIPTDSVLLQRLQNGIQRLNERYATRGEARYLLLHRRRLWNPAEGCWMGWERKRGKLEELNRLLRGATDTSYAHISVDPTSLLSVRYVVTLDADTELPRDVARKLIGTIAHPLNRPRCDSQSRKIVGGHGIIQPRVGSLPVSTRKSRFSRVFAGVTGIDPYTTAVSDVYQDLFGEGSYVGKGIYDVDALLLALAGRVPENRLLSHDLFEGIYARAALATDIEVLDDQPASHAVVSDRQHRWTRGDWQLLWWLFPNVPSRDGASIRNDFRAFDWWRVFDNLRRSLAAPMLVVLMVAGWCASAVSPLLVTFIVLGIFVAPIATRTILSVSRLVAHPGVSLSGLGGELRINAAQAAINLALLLDQSMVACDAIGRALFRSLFSHKLLLQWKAMHQVAGQVRIGETSVPPRLWFGAALALLFFGIVLRSRPEAVVFAGIMFGLFAVSPFIVKWLESTPLIESGSSAISDSDQQFLRLTARRTWRYFTTFVTESDNWLPPDNFQQEPRGVIAHRTSPTNIGLYLLSVASARDFGFITLRELGKRLGDTLSTLERMEHREGHILNWYDTQTLRPLDPMYVSTVDSGNLAAYLWTLRHACEQYVTSPVVGVHTLSAVEDTLGLAILSIGWNVTESDSQRSGLRKALASLLGDTRQFRSKSNCSDVRAVHGHLKHLATALEHLGPVVEGEIGDEEVHYWIGQAQSLLGATLAELDALFPFLIQLNPETQVPQGDAIRSLWQQLSDSMAAAKSPAEIGRAARKSLEGLDTLIELATAAATSTDVTWEEFNRVLFDTRASLEQALNASISIVRQLRLLGARSTAIADEMNFKFLFDTDRCLFYIGYNVGNSRMDTGHYDLLASEARLASLLAIAKGDVPTKHWFRMARPRAAVGSRRTLLSWSGSMFEYLMPLLVTDAYEGSLLAESCSSVVHAQRTYGKTCHVPWGISEAAYNVMDLGMAYQYRAFGVPGLGLKSGLGDELVVAPYASALALMVEPALALKNLRELARLGLEGRYGYFESIDYTPAHVPPGRRSVIVKTFMSHHLGMSLIALNDTLNAQPMKRRFHADARVKSAALLLEERVPIDAPLVDLPTRPVLTPSLAELEPDLGEQTSYREAGARRVHLLGHGELSALITSTGSGFVTWQDLDVNRFREDAVLESGGIYFYIRDHSLKRMWSVGYDPTKVEPDYYSVVFHVDRAELRRIDGDIETVMEVVVSPEHPAEIRRLTLTNHGKVVRNLDLTAYTEVCLAPRAADVAHRAFGNLFIQTEVVPARGALLANRRRRSHAEREIWLVQVLSPDRPEWSELTYDTSRAGFVGRGHTTASPRGMQFDQSLGGAVGNVLDPAMVLRRSILLQPGQRTTISLTTALAMSKSEALAMIETYAEPNSIPRTFELGWVDARVELRHLGIGPSQAHRFQRLLSAIVFPRLELRAPPEHVFHPVAGSGALWVQGISGDLPIVVLRVDTADFVDLARELVLAHEFLRLNGIRYDLVILNEESAGYLQPIHDAALDLIRSTPAQAKLDQHGGIFLRRVAHLSEESRLLLLSLARVVLVASQGSLARQLHRAFSRDKPKDQPMPAASGAAAATMVVPEPRPRLMFDNGLGGFDPSTFEYVMRLGNNECTPMPWCNVIANQSFGTVISESGSGFTWYQNSQRQRLTSFSNDAIVDPSGEVIYIRDRDENLSFALSPAAVTGQNCVVKHGQGYTSFMLRRGGIAYELTVFVGAKDPVKLFRLNLRNESQRARHIYIYGYVEWVLGASREQTRVSIHSQWDAATSTLFASNPFSGVPARTAFFSSSADGVGFLADREEFFGNAGFRQFPSALNAASLSGRSGAGLDPCAVLEVPLELAIRSSQSVAFMLGCGETLESARSLVERYRTLGAVDAALDASKAEWNDVLSAIQIRTPDSALDLLINQWLLYQVTSCRYWARTGFYQSSGAYGFRDQIQDVLALLYTRPNWVREHLLRAASRQFVEGDVQHWWHPDTGEGVRTRCSDDLVWLPYAVAKYVLVTADWSLLDDSVAFIEGQKLGASDDDLYGTPVVSRTVATLYEHCTRALDAAATHGAHDLPKIGNGDWNDGMNRVGAAGEGESVWLAMFLVRTLRDFLPLAEKRRDDTRANWCRQEVARLTRAVEDIGWDGGWYRRAFFDDGTPLGSSHSVECRIDAIAQAWSVISGVADAARGRRAITEAASQLIRQEHQMMLLLTPPFTGAGPDPGYIQAYPPGIRENGGQYTHGVLWTVEALCLLGDGNRAGQLMSMLMPINHALTPRDVAQYQVEPFAVAADIYAEIDHVGRGGWTWYTGAASVMYRIAIERMLGLRREGARLFIEPCIPSDWAGFEVQYRCGKGKLMIKVENPGRSSTGIRLIEVDGVVIDTPFVSLTDDQGTRNVRVVMSSSDAQHLAAFAPVAE